MTMQNYTPISMPSLGKIFDMMKNLPPQQAAQDINSPDPAKKLAAMMVANSDKQLQQQQAAQQQPMPTVAQKLSQGMTQAPTAPTPPMPAVPPQAQAKPGAQGIAALQPQQTPPGSAMGILPTQVAPQTQGAPEPVQKASGGIASFASGGQAQQNQQAQRAQQLAQLMQAINQNSVAAVPQQAQQAGIAAPQQGQANPMQNYASMVFATRPQARPGTEAAPISQDLSLSQLGQYSAQQPIAAAHGGLMHHVPAHMYHFKQGGILHFDGTTNGSSVSNAQDAQADMDASSNPPLKYQSLQQRVEDALQAKGNIYTGQKPTAQQNAEWNGTNAQPQTAPSAPAPIPQANPNSIVNADPNNPGFDMNGLPLSRTQKGQLAANTAAYNTGAQNVAGLMNNRNLLANPQSTNPDLVNMMNEYYQPRGNPTAAPNTVQGVQPSAPAPAAPAPAAAPTAAPGGITQAKTTVPNPFTTTGGITEALPKNEEKRNEERRREKAKAAAPIVAAAPEEKKTGIAAALVPPSDDVTKLANEAMMAGLKVDDAKKRIQDLAEGRKALGISDEAGDSLAEQAKHFDEDYKRQDKSMEHFLKVLNGIAKGGLAGGGVEEENYVTAQRLSDQAHAEKYHDMIRQAKDKTRGEKMTDLNNITAAIDADKAKAGTLGANIYGTNTQAQTARDVEDMRAKNAMAVARLNSSTQYAIAKLSRDAALANKEVTANDIAAELKNDPGYKDMSYADRMSAAFNIKSGLGQKGPLQAAQAQSKILLDFMTKSYDKESPEYKAAAEEYVNQQQIIKELQNKMLNKPQETTSKPPQGAPADAKQAADGKWYSPDPKRPGKYLMWE